MANEGYFDSQLNNAYTFDGDTLLADDLLTVANGDMLHNNAGKVVLAGANDTFLGVSCTAKTYAANNTTFAHDVVNYRAPREASSWKTPVSNGTIAETDIGKFYTIVSAANQSVDAATGSLTKTSSLNLQLVGFINSTTGVWKIDNEQV